MTAKKQVRVIRLLLFYYITNIIIRGGNVEIIIYRIYILEALFKCTISFTMIPLVRIVLIILHMYDYIAAYYCNHDDIYIVIARP